MPSPSMSPIKYNSSANSHSFSNCPLEAALFKKEVLLIFLLEEVIVVEKTYVFSYG